MEEYSRAIARVHAALCALKGAPEAAQVAHAHDFAVELVRNSYAFRPKSSAEHTPLSGIPAIHGVLINFLAHRSYTRSLK